MHLRLFLTPKTTRLLLVALPGIGGAAAALGVYAYSASSPAEVRPPPISAGAPAAPGAPPAELPPSPGLLVHVSGAVARPGLYRLNRGERVYAAIEAAGGLTPGADQQRLPNLAGRLRDGEQVRVPAVKASGAAGSTKTARTDLNTATADQLADVPGFTPELAAAVVALRDSHGPFTSTHQLVTELAMGAADYQLAKAHLHV
jgi:DNA uptake protein ComE-like DNA-binding protein